MDLKKYIKENKLNIIAKPNSPKTSIVEYDSNRKAVKITIAAPPDKNKANRELLKFLSKTLKKKAKIVSGSKSKYKIIEFY